MPTHYETLGISKTASTKDVKQAYRKLALKWHPDRNPHRKAEADAMFKAIANAYAILSGMLLVFLNQNWRLLWWFSVSECEAAHVCTVMLMSVVANTPALVSPFPSLPSHSFWSPVWVDIHQRMRSVEEHLLAQYFCVVHSKSISTLNIVMLISFQESISRVYFGLINT